MLGDKIVVIVNKLLNLPSLIQTLEHVIVDLVGSQEMLERSTKKLLFAFKVPQDKRFTDACGAGHLRKRCISVSVGGEKLYRRLKNLFTRIHFCTVRKKSHSVNASN